MYFLHEDDARLWGTADGTFFINLRSSRSTSSFSIGQTPLSNTSTETEKIQILDVYSMDTTLWLLPRHNQAHVEYSTKNFQLI